MRDRSPTGALPGSLLALAIEGAQTPLGTAPIAGVGPLKLPSARLVSAPLTAVSIAAEAGAASVEQAAAVAAAQLEQGLLGHVRTGTSGAC
jgi:hypothetical protein